MSKVKFIRPTPILKYFNFLDLSREFSCQVPDGEIGSTNMLERLMLVVFSRVVRAKSIFEFGTYRGETTQLFITNGLCENLFSIDLPYAKEEVARNLEDLNLTADVENDEFLTRVRRAEVDNKLMSLSDLKSVKLSLIRRDSRQFEVGDLEKTFDLVFIDGGHTYELIKNDTQKAFRMVKNEGIIFWHDYNSKIHKDVTKYLDELSCELEIYSIGDTGLAFHSCDPNLIKNMLSRS